MTQRLVLGALLGLCIIFVAGCNPGQTSFTGGDGNDDIFANRPIAPRPLLVTVRLSQPPLLEVAQKTAQGRVYPEAAIKAIRDEQDAFLAQLKAVDPKARLIFRYQLVLNAVSVVTSSETSPNLAAIAGVRQVEANQNFTHLDEKESAPAKLDGPTSVDFIGADVAHAKGIDGTGVRVGIIDTGIDYTHAMLGGSGKAEDYKAIDPSQPNAAFPNEKVVGGIDLAGSAYNGASELPIEYIPKPDANPLDEQGHGSHVSGSVAGIGDGIHTYSGVAPGAKLYAIKVFGKAGSTSDAVVIAGLEYAANPSGDLSKNDQLDVVNLSLGSDYGAPHILYAEAIRNLSRAGTAVVAAAGNSGDKNFVVGSPGTVSEAISVAASIDDAFPNWKFDTVKFTTSKDSYFKKAIQGNLTKPVAQSAGVVGNLVDIGGAEEPLTEDQKTALKGQVALIVRGIVPFQQKLQLAFDNGAVGAVVYNNVAGDPVAMSGDEHKFDRPAIMVTDKDGDALKAAMKDGPVSVQFQTDNIIEDKSRIDTIADFSSKGPRSEDDLIKPEIAAPGQAILSAAMGKGNLGVRLDGTSMATPHITGVVALLRQAKPGVSVEDLKSLLMNSALNLKDKTGAVYPISMEGAGRVQIPQALAATAVATPSISLGFVQSTGVRTIEKIVRVKNVSDQPETFAITYQGSSNLKVAGPDTLTLAAREERAFTATFRLQGSGTTSDTEELDAHIRLKGAGMEIGIPAMAVRSEVSEINQATLNGDNLVLQNGGTVSGTALAFNLLGVGDHKVIDKGDEWKSTACELKSVGYRFETEGDKTMLQFGFQVSQPLSQWHYCELNVQFDTDGDGIADLELAGTATGNLKLKNAPEYASLLLNSAAARNIRTSFEKKIRMGLNLPSPNYGPAILTGAPMLAFGSSTIAVIEVDVSALKLTSNTVAIKVATVHGDSANAADPDDFLAGWTRFSLNPEDAAYTNLPEISKIAGHSSTTVALKKGNGKNPLVIYYPNNKAGVDSEILN
jgi:minor extracellular serine protease Vpr